MAGEEEKKKSDESTKHWVDVRVLMREATWAELIAGDRVWYFWPQKKRHAFNGEARGPFEVVDPARCRLKNAQGVELNMPQVKTLLVPTGE